MKLTERRESNQRIESRFERKSKEYNPKIKHTQGKQTDTTTKNMNEQKKNPQKKHTGSY